MSSTTTYKRYKATLDDHAQWMCGNGDPIVATDDHWAHREVVANKLREAADR